jgi:hypothetical protein
MRNFILSTIGLAVILALGLDAAGVSARALVHDARALLVPIVLTALTIGAAILLPSLALSLGLRSFGELSDDERDGPIEPGPARSGVSSRAPLGASTGKIPLPFGP